MFVSALLFVRTDVDRRPILFFTDHFSSPGREVGPLCVCVARVTGQLTDTPTCGLPTRGLDDSWTGHLADWSSRGLGNSRTGQVADWTTRGCHRRLCMLSFRSFGGICKTASCPVRDLSSPRVDQSARCSVGELAIR